ncbi:MAG: Rhodanese-like domain-containing protein [Monoraphidium minutum]|nr:MAG: Rhodanese-like domain-containing protein [Monoraphidium minutum]
MAAAGLGAPAAGGAAAPPAPRAARGGRRVLAAGAHAPALRPRPRATPAPCCSGAALADGPGGGRRQLHARRGGATVCAAASAGQQQEALWESQVREGRVKSVDTRGAAALMQQGWVLLDVRPPNEVAKVSIDGAVAVPLFLPEERSDLASMLKRFSTWATGGWWLGGTHMVANTAFMDEVRARVPPDARVVVGCQRGLRSLAACEQLSRAGYRALAWVNGGFDTAEEGDLPTSPDNKDLRFAGIGGLSEALGWTEVQQQYSRGFLGGAETIIKVVAIFLAVDLFIFAYEYWSMLQADGLPPAAP